ncbi:MAG: response regulator [Planctomycetota bacterium]
MADKKVLCVDDDRGILKYLERLLSKRGYDVVCALGGVQALDVLKEQTVNLIILDIRMPGMDGYQVLDEIRYTDHSSVPVIMLIARDKDEDVVKGYREGADYYITKPFSSETITNIVNYLIGDMNPEERGKLEMSL